MGEVITAEKIIRLASARQANSNRARTREKHLRRSVMECDGGNRIGIYACAKTLFGKPQCVAKAVFVVHGALGLTRHKISDREPSKARHAGEGWMANTQNVSRSLARGSLHRLVRCLRVSTTAPGKGTPTEGSPSVLLAA